MRTRGSAHRRPGRTVIRLSKSRENIFHGHGGTAFFLTPFLRGHGGGGEGTASATRLGYPRQARLLALKAKDEPHPTLMRTPAAPLRGAGRLCQEQSPGRSRYSCVPRPVASQRRRAHLPRGRGQLGKAHGWGGSSGDGFLLRGGPAGVGRTWDGASAPSPLSLRQLRLISLRPPTHLRSVWSTTADRRCGHGRRPIKAAGYRGCGPEHPQRARGPLTAGCHREGWPQRLPLGHGSPAAPWLRASRSG